MAASRRTTSRSTEGVLLVDKPAGLTSHDVVSVARRAVGTSRIGHAGTLDPFATGLLVLLVGRATRLLPYVDGEPKVYHATIRFGVATDTDDSTGRVTASAPVPDQAAVDRAVSALTGDLEQVPPAYSAKQVGGRRAYAAARAGRPLELVPVPVRVHRWEVLERRHDELDVVIECAAGTYIRALARDLGQLAGSAAHLVALRRTRSGAFRVDQAATLDALRDGSALIRPALDALGTLPSERLAPADVVRVLQGRQVPAHALGPRAALLDRSGRLVAIGERSGEMWHPRVVLADD